MKILLSVHHLGSFRMYESVVRELAARGHDMLVIVGRNEALGWSRTLEELMADHPNIRTERLEPPSDDFWFEAAKTIRLWGDYLRYLTPAYSNTPKLRQRAGERLPPVLLRISDSALLARSTWRLLLLRLLRTSERALPRVAAIDEFLTRERPDIILITPLVYLASAQLEVLRSALALGIRTGFCVGSWDHLSSKALLREMPTRVFVWNETQKREAVELHHVPEERVIVTGAQCYDQWFGRPPSRSRDQFCRDVGLPSRPFLLYVGSALFRGSPVEARFVDRWIQELRASRFPELRDMPVLLRPHPARMEEWQSLDFSRHADVVLFGSNPVDGASKDDYFDSLHHCAAVVGLNTSAFIEGAIVGRPVHTILLPEYWENQEGTLHFHYLLTVGGGVLRVGRSYDEHHTELVRSLTAPEPGAGSGFVQAFVRPRGMDVRATDVFVEAVEGMCRLPAPRPVSAPFTLRLFRSLVLTPTLRMGRAALGATVIRTDWSERAKALDQARRAKEEARRAKEEARRCAQEEARRRAEEQARRRAEREEARRRAEQEKGWKLQAHRQGKLEALEQARLTKMEARQRAQEEKAAQKAVRMREWREARKAKHQESVAPQGRTREKENGQV